MAALFATLIFLTAVPLSHTLLNLLTGGRITENYQKTLEPLSLSTAPIAVFGWIPLLNMFSIAYWLLISFTGFKKSYQVGNWKASVGVLPLLAWGVILVTLMLESGKLISYMV